MSNNRLRGQGEKCQMGKQNADSNSKQRVETRYVATPEGLKHVAWHARPRGVVIFLLF